jgi:putative spermidine/putrescine transport system substrate-binding protein
MKPWGVEHLFFANVLATNAGLVPDKSKQPTNYREFWDTSRFPGTRTLQSGQNGDEGPWEEALLADGVDPSAIYPIDIDRAFRSLDKIKPSVRRWWVVGAEAMQLFGGNQVAFGTAPDGRILSLRNSGKPVEFSYVNAKATGIYWAIPKSAPNAEVAQEFIAFAMKAQPQAEVARLTNFAPVNGNAFQFIDDKLAKTLVSYPDNMKNAILLDAEWYAQVGEDGKTNSERLAERWNKWVLQ